MVGGLNASSHLAPSQRHHISHLSLPQQTHRHTLSSLPPRTLRPLPLSFIDAKLHFFLCYLSFFSCFHFTPICLPPLFSPFYPFLIGILHHSTQPIHPTHSTPTLRTLLIFSQHTHTHYTQKGQMQSVQQQHRGSPLPSSSRMTTLHITKSPLPTSSPASALSAKFRTLALTPSSTDAVHASAPLVPVSPVAIPSLAPIPIAFATSVPAPQPERIWDSPFRRRSLCSIDQPGVVRSRLPQGKIHYTLYYEFPNYHPTPSPLLSLGFFFCAAIRKVGK